MAITAGTPCWRTKFDRRRHIEEQVEELQSAGIDAELDIETTNHGTPREIAAVADHVGADAIVCGTRGLGGLFGLLTGSVAADLLREATVPVIVVPAKAAGRVPITAGDRRQPSHIPTHAAFIG